MSDYKFIPYVSPRCADGQFFIVQFDHDILRARREQLGLSQQQVADIAHIQLRQYQRLESAKQYLSGCSMRIGLSVCAALYLDPYDFMGLNIQQPDLAPMLSPYANDSGIPLDLLNAAAARKRPGRKPSKKEALRVYLDRKKKLVILPPSVFDALQSPMYLQALYNEDNNHIAVRAASASDEQVIPMPSHMPIEGLFAISTPDFSRTLQPEAKQAEMLIAEVQLVKDSSGRFGIMVDPSIAIPSALPDAPIVQY